MAGFLSSLLGIASGGLSTVGNFFNAGQQYKYQRKLNEQAYDLTQKGYRESVGNIRKGLENAGYNPLLAVDNLANAQFSGGSASVANNDVGTSFASGVNSGKDLWRLVNLEKSKVRAEIDNINSATNANNAQAFKAQKEAMLLEYDKPLKLIGDAIENPAVKEFLIDVLPDIPNKVNDGLNNGYQNFKHNLKNNLRKNFWRGFDGVGDIYEYFNGVRKGSNVPYRYYKGLTRSNRIRDKVYSYKDIFRK